ncbi:hypothetical protein HYDPIDRAFT_118669 [Hydnomerulius pinastri MD-312]|uniref:Uncharacterized protein n=1 Tax=Hydnomerulius pinastri MD-312 TaxID=994086 RepID=A0A0C9W8G7_9AGAM|nr:hypothetical protein HYDPIDRAFT_118669 [Hydnomerulius pinastri MD-312]
MLPVWLHFSLALRPSRWGRRPSCLFKSSLFKPNEVTHRMLDDLFDARSTSPVLQLCCSSLHPDRTFLLPIVVSSLPQSFESFGSSVHFVFHLIRSCSCFILLFRSCLPTRFSLPDVFLVLAIVFSRFYVHIPVVSSSCQPPSRCMHAPMNAALG